jgi:hypothetical protein
MHTSQVGAEDQIPVIGSIIGARRQKRSMTKSSENVPAPRQSKTSSIAQSRS